MQNPGEWEATPVASGPASWQRVQAVVDSSRRIGEPGDSGRNVDVVVPSGAIEPVDLPAVKVNEVVVAEQSVSFSVDQVGVPVLVRVSYFPNWRVDGADGPYRVAPNMMVVVPTDRDVRLHFDMSWRDNAAYLLTVVGAVVLFVLVRRERKAVG
jgi:hypothetical protein